MFDLTGVTFIKVHGISSPHETFLLENISPEGRGAVPADRELGAGGGGRQGDAGDGAAHAGGDQGGRRGGGQGVRRDPGPLHRGHPAGGAGDTGAHGHGA